MRQLSQQQTRQNNSQRCDRMRIMPLGTYAASRAGGSPTLARKATNPVLPARVGGGKTVPLGDQEPISCDA